MFTIAVKPTDSPVITQALAEDELKPGLHKIQGQGIGGDFIPDNLDLNLIERGKITNDEAINTANRLMEESGILPRIFSGAAVSAALKLQGEENFAKNIVVILPSSDESYLRTESHCLPICLLCLNYNSARYSRSVKKAP